MVASCKRQGGLDGRGEKPRAGWKRRIRRFPAAKEVAITEPSRRSGRRQRKRARCFCPVLQAAAILVGHLVM
ncbi:hypothetical protein HPP92_026437 [Vanilla planifolia]|uniref:Uncharacterized protein n=1 Tax=Vanilla planifolia TaxID=51239 RepID=A0A835U9G6_VANPL|nr:hypothetical protein HPP92_026437 [Vanilla planifolia]